MKIGILIAAVAFALLYWLAHGLLKAGKDKPLRMSEYDDTERFYNE